MDEVKVEYFIPSIYYVVTDFLQDQRNESCGEIFKQVINTLFLLYVAYIEFLFFCICFNKLKLMTETFHYFSGEKKDYAKKKKRINFSFLKLFVFRGRRILDYLNVVLNDLSFSHTFLTYRANINYFSDHLLITNSK